MLIINLFYALINFNVEFLFLLMLYIILDNDFEENVLSVLNLHVCSFI